MAQVLWCHGPGASWQTHSCRPDDARGSRLPVSVKDAGARFIRKPGGHPGTKQPGLYLAPLSGNPELSGCWHLFNNSIMSRRAARLSSCLLLPLSTPRFREATEHKAVRSREGALAAGRGILSGDAGCCPEHRAGSGPGGRAARTAGCARNRGGALS